MCGITAIVDRRHSTLAPVITSMTEALRHRGPDDAGIWQAPDGTVALGHRRLSIVDLSVLGRNPMTLGRGSSWITYNGEVYNYRALRSELQRDGYSFVSETDTEVVLAAYDRWGIDCLERFVGMFAFALWDGSKGRLTLARDRLGKKPLYYARYADRFVVASELKAVLADPAFPREIEPSAIPLYLKYGYIPSPATIYRHAFKLPPGHFATLTGDDLQVRRYWDPVAIAAARSEASDPSDELAALDRVLREAVALRLVADVPVGAFLSGGIDSSLVVALMKEASPQPVRTFTIRFANAEYNEADHAAAVARHLGTEHHEETCGDRELLGVVDRLPEMFDEPFADASAIPTFLVSRVARERVTVALSGDGGDELFHGYPRYAHHANAGWMLAMPQSVRRAVAVGAARLPTRRLRRVADVLRSDDPDRYARFITWWQVDEIAALTGRSPDDAALYADARARTATLDEAARPPLLDLVSYLPDDILAKVDRTSMAVSLEARAPLLDHRVVELALRMPAARKRSGSLTKWPLRRLLYQRVPRALVERPKMGFGVPLDDWFRGPLRRRMDDYCAGPDLELVGVDPQPVRRLWTAFQSGRSQRADLLWQMFCLVAWHRFSRSRGGRLQPAV
jgi:asparagine synthase (glutamine-hydrolysing)